LRKAEKSIKHSQRRIYKKLKGSLCIRKVKEIYSKKHLKLTRQRIGHAKTVARCVIKSNDLVAYKDSRVANMVKTHCLAKLISDVSWYLFRQWLEYFAIKFGKVAIAVMPHYTSEKCSSCGVIVNIAKARVGQTQSNAKGLATSTLLGENLVEQVTKVKLESQRL
jgi:putative transposase